MNPPNILDQEWQTMLHLLPSNRDEAARRLGALTRRRQIREPDDLLRLAFVYAWGGLSLRNTVAWARHRKVATLSDVALMERLQKAEAWFGWLLGEMIRARSSSPNLQALPYRVRVVDATVLTQPGSKGTDWRVHLSLDLCSGATQSLQLTDAKGGETLTRYAVEKDDLFLADRGYAHRKGLAHVVAAGGQVLVRFAWQNLPLQEPDGTSWDLIGALSDLAEGQVGEWEVQTAPVASEKLPALRGRVIALRKSAQAAEAAKRVARKNARKKGHTPDARTLLCCEFVLLFTSVPTQKLSGSLLLDLYRFRWQIECGFKRLKSVLHLSDLPAQEARLCRAWVYAKLLGALLVETFACSWASFSPWGQGGKTECLALAAVADDLALLTASRGDRSVRGRMDHRSHAAQAMVLRPAA